jgi:hypothetical protein
VSVQLFRHALASQKHATPEWQACIHTIQKHKQNEIDLFLIIYKLELIDKTDSLIDAPGSIHAP